MELSFLKAALQLLEIMQIGHPLNQTADLLAAA
jgi:hypothetical protein